MTDAPRPDGRDIWVRLLLYPTHTLPTAAAPVIVGSALAMRDGVFVAWAALLALLGSWLIHVGGVFADNHELLRRHADVPEHPELLAALDHGVLSLGTLKTAFLGCFILGSLAGIPIVLVAGWPAAVIGVAGVVASYGYHGHGIRYVRLGLADGVFFVMFGVVAVAGTYAAQAFAALEHGTAEPMTWARALPLRALLLGLPVGALVTNVMIVDDIRDRAWDALKGWRTGPVRFGLRFSRVEWTGFLALAYLSPFVLWLGFGFHPWILAPLATLPMAWRIARTVWRTDNPGELLPMSPAASKLALWYSANHALGLVVGPS